MTIGLELRQLSIPEVPNAASWVREHLSDLFEDSAPDRKTATLTKTSSAAVPSIRGGQEAADQALALTSLAGYSRYRNEVWPKSRRGATALSPYIRHGLLTLDRVWQASADAPAQDRTAFRQELLWQEYSRHFYARMGSATQEALRFRLPEPVGDFSSGWPEGMACVDGAVAELHSEGWLTNQQRMWLASHWGVRLGWDWRAGEDRFFAQLLDGSRAANRIGWQWTVGALTGKPYGFSRWQVTKRAPRLCATCALADACPIEQWPDDRDAVPRPDADPRLRRDLDLRRTTGPTDPEEIDPRTPDAVWITAESLGDEDPALQAHPDLPVYFIWDAPLLQRLRLATHRAVFLTESLADLAQRRELQVWRGDPRTRWFQGSVATTFAPVPGWRTRASVLNITRLHPWPWLTRPHSGPIQSFSTWRRKITGPRSQP